MSKAQRYQQLTSQFFGHVEDHDIPDGTGPGTTTEAAEEFRAGLSPQDRDAWDTMGGLR